MRRGGVAASIAGVFLVVAFSFLLTPRAHAQGGASPAMDLHPVIAASRWQLYALEYARSESVPEARLIADADPAARRAMSWYFFVAVGFGRVVLIDCGSDGFVHPQAESLRRAWSVRRWSSVPNALARVGLAPADVTDIVLTHHHWDHVDGLRHFPSAQVFSHPREWERVSEALRAPVQSAGRFHPIEGAVVELWPGFAARRQGAHTRDQLTVDVRCRELTLAIVSDGAYLFRNIEEGVAVAVSRDPRANVRDVATAVSRVGREHVIPGHDPLLFERYPAPVEGVAALCR